MQLFVLAWLLLIILKIKVQVCYSRRTLTIYSTLWLRLQYSRITVLKLPDCILLVQSFLNLESSLKIIQDSQTIMYIATFVSTIAVFVSFFEGLSADGTVVPSNENYLEGSVTADGAGYLLDFSGDGSKFILVELGELNVYETNCFSTISDPLVFTNTVLSMCLSDDGNIFAVLYLIGTGYNAVQVYQNQASLPLGGCGYDTFGSLTYYFNDAAISMTADGNMIVGGSDVGAGVVILTYSTDLSDWVSSYIPAPVGSGAAFPYSLSISSDGSRIVALDDIPSLYTFAAAGGGGWELAATTSGLDIATGSSGGFYSGDCSRFAVKSGIYSQTVNVFSMQENGHFAQLGNSISSPVLPVYFGDSAAFSNDGGYLVVGDPGVNSDAGAAYMFTFDGMVWNAFGDAIAGAGGADEQFGYHMSFTSDGLQLAVGAPFSETAANGNCLLELFSCP